MNFSRGDLSEFEVRFARMAVKHAAEVGMLGASRMLPNMRAYKAVEDAGRLRMFYAYDSDGQPAGYQAFLVIEHPHYSGTLMAQADAMYVRPESRGYLGGRFLLWADEQLKAEGVGAVMRSSSERAPIGSLLEGMGYHAAETHYMKEL